MKQARNGGAKIERKKCSKVKEETLDEYIARIRAKKEKKRKTAALLDAQ